MGKAKAINYITAIIQNGIPFCVKKDKRKVVGFSTLAICFFAQNNHFVNTNRLKLSAVRVTNCGRAWE